MCLAIDLKMGKKSKNMHYDCQSLKMLLEPKKTIFLKFILLKVKPEFVSMLS